MEKQERAGNLKTTGLELDIPTSSSSDNDDNCDDNESTDCSLEILPPVNKFDNNNTRKNENGTTRKKTIKKHSIINNNVASVGGCNNNNDGANSDSDDSLLLNAVLSRNNNQASAAATTSTIKKSAAASKTTKRTSPTKRNSKSKTNDNSDTSSNNALKKIRKEQEKAARAKEREAKKREREKQKEAEKARKKQDIEERRKLQASATGKFAHDEIVVLMDPDLHQNAELGLVDALSHDFIVKKYPSTLPCKKAVQWIRKDYLKGGAQDIVQALQENRHDDDNQEHLDRLAFVLCSDDFIPLLIRQKGSEDDDYPALALWIENVIEKWQKTWRKPCTDQPKIILFLYGVREALDRQWVEHNRNRNSHQPALPTDGELDDAIRWILIQYQVECTLCSTYELIQLYMHKLTRALCEAPYHHQVSELECVKKLKQAPASDAPLDRAKDTWFRQLQQIPRLSTSMAENVIQHYPTAFSLWKAYQQTDEQDCRHLLAGVLNTRKNCYKVSEHVHKIITSPNPDDILS